MKKIIIFGTSDFSRQMHWYITHDTNKKVVCFCADKEYITESKFLGLPIVPFDQVKNEYASNDHEILLAIGQSKMNDIRKRVFFQAKDKGYTIASYVHSSSIVQTTEIGEGNIILERCAIQPFVKIGDGNLLWDNVFFAHDNIIGNFNTFSGNAGLSGYVEVKNNCYLGKHSMVFDHILIEDYTLVGAGAYVRKNTQPYSVIVPAQSIVLEGKKSTDFF